MATFPTSHPSKERSPLGRPIDTSITPKPIGSSRPTTPASNSRGSTPNFERLGRLVLRKRRRTISRRDRLVRWANKKQTGKALLFMSFSVMDGLCPAMTDRAAERRQLFHSRGVGRRLVLNLD